MLDSEVLHNISIAKKVNHLRDKSSKKEKKMPSLVFQNYYYALANCPVGSRGVQDPRLGLGVIKSNSKTWQLQV